VRVMSEGQEGGDGPGCSPASSCTPTRRSGSPPLHTITPHRTHASDFKEGLCPLPPMSPHLKSPFSSPTVRSIAARPQPRQLSQDVPLVGQQVGMHSGPVRRQASAEGQEAAGLQLTLQTKGLAGPHHVPPHVERHGAARVLPAAAPAPARHLDNKKHDHRGRKVRLCLLMFRVSPPAPHVSAACSTAPLFRLYPLPHSASPLFLLDASHLLDAQP
jgi:hypothetical protein